MVCHGKAPHILLWARVPWGIIWCSEQHKYKYTQIQKYTNTNIHKLNIRYALWCRSWRCKQHTYTNTNTKILLQRWRRKQHIYSAARIFPLWMLLTYLPILMQILCIIGLHVGMADRFWLFIQTWTWTWITAKNHSIQY